MVLTVTCLGWWVVVLLAFVCLASGLVFCCCSLVLVYVCSLVVGCGGVCLGGVVWFVGWRARVRSFRVA